MHLIPCHQSLSEQQGQDCHFVHYDSIAVIYIFSTLQVASACFLKAVEYGPGLIVHCREDMTILEQFLARLVYSIDVHPHRASNLLHMNSFVALRRIFDGLIHFPCTNRDITEISIAILVIVRCIHGIPIASSLSGIGSGFGTTHWSTCEMEMYKGSIKHVMANLVVVVHGSNKVRAYMALAVEGLKPSKGLDIRVLLQLRVPSYSVTGIFVDPVLDFNFSGAVVNLVCDVRRLLGLVADLADEYHLDDKLERAAN
jgi:hypothetical protein